jgi:hypothetical protein
MIFRDPATLQPEHYARMPKPGRKFLGMGRTTLQNLADDGYIEVISVQRRGASRGLKLIYLPSLFDYLDGLRRTQSSKTSADLHEQPK